ncbi:hypothetical protein OFC13_28650, partial [Escherichia coli]|nr:hypothetical protein [Escherichia coli]
IWFHLSYYSLDGFLRENKSDDERRVVVRKRKYNDAVPDAPVISDENRRRCLLAYSIIWSSV